MQRPLCVKALRLTRRLTWLLYTLDHTMPPCSTNRSITQLLKRVCHPYLSLAPTTRCLCLTRAWWDHLFSVWEQEMKRDRRRKERKNWMLPLLPVNRGFDIASLCYRGVEINMETVREKKEKWEEKRESSVGMPAVWLSISLLHQFCSTSPNVRRTAFHWTKTKTKSSNIHIRHKHEHGSLYFQLYFFNSHDVYYKRVNSCLDKVSDSWLKMAF